METWFWILGWFFSILTMTGNGFIILLVCTRRHLRTKTNAFVVSLAVADFFVGMTAVPSLFLLERIGRGYSQGLYTGLKNLKWLFQDASVINMCSLVLDRYIAVVKPLKYLTFMTSRRVIQLISFSWGLCVVFILVLSSLSFSLNPRVVSRILFCVVFVLFYFLPCLMISFCFASMLRVIYMQNRAPTFLGKQLRFNKRREKSALIMMMIVVSLFFVFSFVVRNRAEYGEDSRAFSSRFSQQSQKNSAKTLTRKKLKGFRRPRSKGEKHCNNRTNRRAVRHRTTEETAHQNSEDGNAQMRQSHHKVTTS